MPSTPREIAEQVRKMVEGRESPTQFADMFAEDGVMEYPFFVPGFQSKLEGQQVIREWFSARAGMRDAFDMQEVTAEVFETDDPEVVITEIRHRGMSRVTNAPYELRALGIIRVREGKIVYYRDYMNPLALAQLTGRLSDVVAAYEKEPASAAPAGS